MMNFKKCVHVQDASKVAYWRKHDDITIYPLEGGTLEVLPGKFVVWVAGDDCPRLHVLDEGEFSDRFVTEENLPDALKDHLKLAPNYKEWVKTTYVGEDGLKHYYATFWCEHCEVTFRDKAKYSLSDCPICGRTGRRAKKS